jgi:molybdopterin-containing oxidoreductase family membrane subunit
LGLWAIAAVVGAIGLFERLVHGDQAAAFSSYVPWGLWVAAYIYFSGLSAGAFLVAAAAYGLNIKVLQPIGRLSLLVALVCLAMGLLAIGLDLGHMERAVLVFVRPQFHSVMAWMVWLYTAYVIVLSMMFVRMSKAAKAGEGTDPTQDGCRFRGLGLIGTVLALGIATGAGSLFATVAAREFWHTSLLPIFFIVGALTSGTALVTAVVAWLWPERDKSWQDMMAVLGRLVLALVVVELVMEAAEFLVPAWYGVGAGYDVVMHLLFGPQWYVFWIFHLLLGAILPLALLVGKRSAGSIGLAAALVAVMFFAVRYNLVVPGQIVPAFQGLDAAYSDPVGGKLSFLYAPTWFEWEVLIGIVAIGLALWFLGVRRFPWVFPGSSTPSNEVRS